MDAVDGIAVNGDDRSALDHAAGACDPAAGLGGAEVKFEGWTQTKPVDAIKTGSGLITSHAGDFVIVIVVPRYEDTGKALDVVKQLTATEPPE